MRLWHYKILPYLPNSQLVAQWRELNSIFKKQDKHILINYIYEYKNKSVIYHYAKQVIEELTERNYKIRNFDNFNNYFINERLSFFAPNFIEHNNEYLTICYCNLKEKYLRGQKDFTKEIWEKLEEFYKKEIEE